MSGRWWRAYDEAVDDPKLVLLSDRQHRAWFNLMCIASANEGILPGIDVIAVKLRMSVAKAEAVIETLRQRGLIDPTEAGLQPHNWGGRQFKSDVSTERVKRFREHRRNVSSGVSETAGEAKTKRPQRQSTETETEREEKKDAASRPSGDQEVELFRRGKQLLGEQAGGLIANLKKAKGGSIPLARAALETAATKENPREYIGAVIRGPVDNTAADPMYSDGWHRGG